ncbi:signal peptidase I [Methylococcus sp. EFPC2]|uniref:signal peptidase I n=1 Tax=Methylococcus sp. EFPC2 TaxID=2812648 RepID=UPI001F088263|nr:signal peptidase I [Methylococcus sp. EFPC2]
MSAPNPDRLPFMTAKALFLLKAMPVLAAILSLGAYLGDRFHLGIDDQKELCLPGDHRWFLIDRHDQNIWRGDRVAFEADERMTPWFLPGRVVVKIATGVSGDHVQVDLNQTVVNGKTVSNGLALSEKLGKTPSDYTRQVNIPGNAIWVTGSHPRSFDSRYWGFVYERQIIGKAYALPF